MRAFQSQDEDMAISFMDKHKAIPLSPVPIKSEEDLLTMPEIIPPATTTDTNIQENSDECDQKPAK